MAEFFRLSAENGVFEAFEGGAGDRSRFGGAFFQHAFHLIVVSHVVVVFFPGVSYLADNGVKQHVFDVAVAESALPQAVAHFPQLFGGSDGFVNFINQNFIRVLGSSIGRESVLIEKWLS